MRILLNFIGRGQRLVLAISCFAKRDWDYFYSQTLRQEARQRQLPDTIVLQAVQHSRRRDLHFLSRAQEDEDSWYSRWVPRTRLIRLNRSQKRSGSLVPVFLSPDGKVPFADPLAAHRYMTFHDPVIQLLRSLARSLLKCGFFSSSREMKKILYDTMMRDANTRTQSFRWIDSMFLVDAGNSPLVRPRAIDLTRGIGIASSLSFYRFDFRLEKSSASDLFRYINVLFYTLYRSDKLTLVPLVSFSRPSLFVLFLSYSFSWYKCLLWTR